MKTNSKLIAVSAVTFALTAVLGLFPFVFLIPVIFTCVTRDWKMSLVESTFFGVLSLAYSFMTPNAASPVAIAFMENPWLPILPRIAVGLGCHFTYVAVKRAFRNKNGRAALIVPVVVASAVGSILNTAIIVPLLLLVAGNSLGLGALWVSSTLVSGAIELAVAVIVVPPLTVTVGRALRLLGYITQPAQAAAETFEAASDTAEEIVVPDKEDEKGE